MQIYQKLVLGLVALLSVTGIALSFALYTSSQPNRQALDTAPAKAWKQVTTDLSALFIDKGSLALSFEQYPPLKASEPAKEAILGVTTKKAANPVKPAVPAKPVAYKDKLTIKSRLYLSSDSVGQAKIKAGTTSVRIIFTTPYEYQPVVTVTPIDYDGKWKLKEINNEGFTLKLSETNTQDITFNWHSFAGEGAKLTVSDGTMEEIVLIVP